MAKEKAFQNTEKNIAVQLAFYADRMKEICIWANQKAEQLWGQAVRAYKSASDSQATEKDKVGSDVGADAVREFPVDIRKIAKALDVRICETRLNLEASSKNEHIYGYLTYNYKEKQTIYVENSEKESVKRYIIAQELCRWFLTDKVVNEKNIPGFGDAFQGKKEELLSEMVAAFLMFPPHAVEEAIGNDNKEWMKIYSIGNAERMRLLGQKAQIPTQFTIVSYQYLRWFWAK